MDDAQRVGNEVRRLHRFFAGWFAGGGGLAIEAFSDSLDEQFSIVGPNGSVLGKAEIVHVVEERFGVDEMYIGIENVDVLSSGGVAVCRYEEVQRTDDSETRRLSTAVMVDAQDAPGGFRWLAVHETWIPLSR